MLKKKNINLVIKDNLNLYDYEVLCDWKLFQLIFFNFFQNSVKYNEKDGNIKIELNLMNLY